MTDSLLTPEEEQELLDAIKTPSPNKNETASSTSSSSCSSWSSSSSSFESSSSSLSSSSSSSNSSTSSSSSSSNSSSVSSSIDPNTLQSIQCDISPETRLLFSTINNAWLLKENNFHLEKVRLWYYDPGSSVTTTNDRNGKSMMNNSNNKPPGWHHQDQVVCVSRQPFSVGAMRASFFLSDVTRQVSPDILGERIRKKKQQREEEERMINEKNKQQQSLVLSILGSLPKPSTSIVIESCSFKQPFLVQKTLSNNENSVEEDTSSNINSNSNRECYVAKAYRRFLFRKPESLSAHEKREEMARHFRDAHMQSVAQHWVQRMNSQRPPCPRLNFVPVWVMQRLEPQAARVVSENKNNKNKDDHEHHEDNQNNNKPIATSSPCEFLSVEPMLNGIFTKHNNNNGFVRGNNPMSPTTSATTTMMMMSTPLEMETRDAANALLHYSYVMSSRTLMVCDIQGVETTLTDPQIHTIDGSSFGRGNLGPKGMYKCLKSHRCSRVCKALDLKEIDIEMERVYLQQMDRKRKKGESTTAAKVGVVGEELPAELERYVASKHLDFDF